MVKLMERHRIIKCQCLQTPIRTRLFQEVCIFTSLTIGFHYDSPIYTLILLMHLDASRCMILHVRATRIAFLIESITWSAIVCGGEICYCGSRVFTSWSVISNTGFCQGLMSLTMKPPIHQVILLALSNCKCKFLPDSSIFGQFSFRCCFLRLRVAQCATR